MTRSHEFTADEIAELLSELDARLRERRVRASISSSAVPRSLPTGLADNG
ncbi:MAG: hypothetical protein ACRCXL_13620 [Dermatophilaceae bacterium]